MVVVAAIESTIQITVTLGAVISPAVAVISPAVAVISQAVAVISPAVAVISQAVAVISPAVAVISPVLEEEVGNRRCLKLNAFRYFYFIQKVFYLFLFLVLNLA